MPDGVVINTGPLIALAIGCGDWQILEWIGVPVSIPVAVVIELEAGSPGSPGRDLVAGIPLGMVVAAVPVPTYLTQTLDAGEASVIATALALGVSTVAIDELAGRRVARTCCLSVTGSLGLLVAARKRGYRKDIAAVTARMRTGGIRLSDRVIAAAIQACDNG